MKLNMYEYDAAEKAEYEAKKSETMKAIKEQLAELEKDFLKDKNRP